MNILTEKLIELAEEEAGIKLRENEIELVVEESDLILKIWGEELIATEFIDESDYNDEAFADELMGAIKDEYYDFRERLIEIKLASLNLTHSDFLKAKVVEILSKSKVDSSLLAILDFEFMDVSSKDKDQGLPNVALRITDFEKIECFCPVDITKVPVVLDEKKIADDLLKKYR
ncbi:hypothetical protein [uncultured Cytophaga sp.]|uniref:hypothetical protein n=1 Tax=uncultured Cytophaga sp. TaxID=160238 RepID=UPI00260D3AA5|nr:hypothetical protein [uncultured Cytophaga sp.]